MSCLTNPQMCEYRARTLVLRVLEGRSNGYKIYIFGYFHASLKALIENTKYGLSTNLIHKIMWLNSAIIHGLRFSEFLTKALKMFKIEHFDVKPVQTPTLALERQNTGAQTC